MADIFANVLWVAIAIVIFILINKMFDIFYLGIFAIVSVFIGCLIAAVFVLEIIAPFLKFVPWIIGGGVLLFIVGSKSAK